MHKKNIKLNMESVSVVEEKKTKKTKSSKKAVQQPSEESIEISQPVEVQKIIEEFLPVEEEKVIEEVNENVDTPENGEETNLASKEDFIKMLEDIVVLSTSISKINLKDFQLSKEFVTYVSKQLKQTNKLIGKMNDNYTDLLLKESLPSIKKNEKQKKQSDKSKHNVNIPKKTFNEVLKFMKLEPDTLVSIADVQRAINGFVREQKQAGNQNIMVEGNNNKFKIIDELKDLFNFFEKQIKSGNYKGKIPEIKEEMSYSDIFSYTKFCFEPTK